MQIGRQGGPTRNLTNHSKSWEKEETVGAEGNVNMCRALEGHNSESFRKGIWLLDKASSAWVEENRKKIARSS